MTSDQFEIAETEQSRKKRALHVGFVLQNALRNPLWQSCCKEQMQEFGISTTELRATARDEFAQLPVRGAAAGILVACASIALMHLNPWNTVAACVFAQAFYCLALGFMQKRMPANSKALPVYAWLLTWPTLIFFSSYYGGVLASWAPAFMLPAVLIICQNRLPRLASDSEHLQRVMLIAETIPAVGVGTRQLEMLWRSAFYAGLENEPSFDLNGQWTLTRNDGRKLLTHNLQFGKPEQHLFQGFGVEANGQRGAIAFATIYDGNLVMAVQPTQLGTAAEFASKLMGKWNERTQQFEGEFSDRVIGTGSFILKRDAPPLMLK